MRYTINEFRRDYHSDDACLDMIFKLRYKKMPCCPQCSQQTTFKRIPGRRAYQCSDKDCQYQLYPTAGTVFEKTRTSLANIFYVIYLMTSTRNGVSAKEIERQLGVTYKCAWRLGHRIRQLMANGMDGLLSGIIEADETYMGGKAKNKHKNERKRINYNAKGKNSPKIGVFAMLERNGNVIAKPIPETNASILHSLIKGHIKEGSKLVTDSHPGYTGILGYKHTVVNHDKDEFVKGTKHTNTVEGFFSHLKRMIGGTHIKVSRKYLQYYIDEHSFRYVYRDHGQKMFHRILLNVA